MQTVSNNLRVLREPARVVISSKRIGRANWPLEILLFFISLACLLGPLPQLLASKNLLSLGSLLTLLLMIAGFLLVYRFITLLVDADTVEITPEQIKVRAGPLPAWDSGCPSIRRENLAGVEAKTHIATSQNQRSSGATVTFGVLATLRDGSTRSILSGSKNPEPIHFIANEIVTFYHL